MIKCVIFDLDGTLIDTEKYYRIAWPKTFEHLGYNMTDDQYLFIRSLGKPFIYDTLKEFSGNTEFDYDAAVKVRNVYMKELISEDGLKAKKGAVELLSFLKEKGIVTCIATASPVSRAEEYLKAIGLLEYFDKIVSARDMKEGKPSPDVYEYAVKQLGFESKDCLAVEDSPNGVLSASRAKLDVIMIPDQSPCDEQSKKLILAEKESLSEIISIFENT